MEGRHIWLRMHSGSSGNMMYRPATRGNFGDAVTVPFVPLLLSWMLFAPPQAMAAERSTAIPASLLQRVPPRYPAKAIDSGQEGWVDLHFTITPEGATSDIRVVASYPRGLFERNAANALMKWIYTPRTENGIAVPQADNHAVVSFALGDNRTVHDRNDRAFTAATAQLAARDWAGAENSVNDLASQPGLGLYELAMIEQFRGRVAFGKADYPTAIEQFRRALSITSHFDDETRGAISELLVMAQINGQQPERALATFDAWNPPDTAQYRDVRRAVESIRTGSKTRRRAELPASTAR